MPRVARSVAPHHDHVDGDLTRQVEQRRFERATCEFRFGGDRGRDLGEELLQALSGVVGVVLLFDLVLLGPHPAHREVVWRAYVEVVVEQEPSAGEPADPDGQLERTFTDGFGAHDISSSQMRLRNLEP